ncbi:MAG: ABC transporter permease [Marinilabiliales bacterium]|nr:MAG: ABC transporter permease [Marinilabiliales bacterium]
MRDAFRYAGKEIRRRKQRSAGTVISYLTAGAIIVLAASLSGTTRDNTQQVLWDIGAHTVAYIPRLTIEGCCIQTYATDLYDPDREGFVANNAPTNLIFDEQIEMIRQSPNVADAAPYLMFRIRSSLGQGEWVLGGLDLTRPVAHSATVVAGSQVVKGEFIEPGDDGLVMVEREFAGAYNFDVGSELLLGDMNYRIAAIVNPPLRPGKANIYMSLPALHKLVETRLEETVENPVNAVLVESVGAQYHEAALADVSNILGQSSRISSFGCWRPGITVMGITANTAWTITAIVIICMLLIAMKIQIASVVQRRFEMGVLKAIGWSDGNILSQLMAESLIYSFTGGAAGVLVAYTTLQVLPAELTGGGQSVTPLIIVTGVLLPVAGGLVAGLISSLRAVRMRTADIIRTI